MAIQPAARMKQESVLTARITQLETIVNVVKKGTLEMPPMVPVISALAHFWFHPTVLLLDALALVGLCNVHANLAILEHSVKGVLLATLEIP